MNENDSTPKSERIVIHGDPEMKELIENFLKNRCQDILQIHQAVETKDFETVRTLGHSMKGSGSGYGFDQVTIIGAHLEEYAKIRNAEDIHKSVDELQSYLDRVEVLYE